MKAQMADLRKVHWPLRRGVQRSWAAPMGLEMFRAGESLSRIA